MGLENKKSYRDLVESIKIEVYRNLSVDEKIRIMSSISDTIMKIKLEKLKEELGIEDDKEAIRILREKLMKLQEHG